jgi:hypothetical protein
MTDTPAAEQPIPEEFIGYAAAGKYLGLRGDTLSSYVSHGHGPTKDRDVREGQYVRPVFTRTELDRWQSQRPGQGRRTDLVRSGE